MTAMTEERPIFENEEWLVTGSGLEHKTTGYFIERESLAQRRDDGLWTWPLHMAEKSWCAMMPFAEAFSCAAAVYNVKTGADLAQTFKIARCEVSPWPQAKKQASNHVLSMSPTLRPARANPIFIGSGLAEEPLNGQGFQSPGEIWRMRSKTGARLFLTTSRNRPERLSMARATALSWRAPRRIRQTGTKLVRLLQAAWNIR
jgi:hypothetical protein